MKKRILTVLIMTLMLVAILPTTAFAAHNSHDNMAFQGWYSDKSLPTKAGNYYLNYDVTFNEDDIDAWNVSSEINLCLNGHKIIKPWGVNIIDVNDGGKLSIYDCTKTTHKFDVAENGRWVLNETSGKKSVTGGFMMSNRIQQHVGYNFGVSVRVNSGGTFNMYGGTITGNVVGEYGGGVYVGKNGIFNMYGGTIADNHAANGGGVYIGSKGVFTLTGGTVKNNVVSNNGGGVYSDGGNFNLNGGTVTGNTSANNGGGVIGYSGHITVTDDSITNNSAANNGGGIFISRS